MKAVIVAAGMGKRINTLIKGSHKCLLDFKGKPLILNSIDNLLKLNIIDEIFIVVGYNREKLINIIGDKVTYIYNPFYKISNNVVSLWLIKYFVTKDPFIYLHCDIVYSLSILKKIIKTDSDIVLAVKKHSCDHESMKVSVTKDMKFKRVGKNIPLSEAFGEWTGIMKFSHRGWLMYIDAMERYLENNLQAYEIEVLNLLKDKDVNITIVPFEKEFFKEIDTPEDYKEVIRKI